MSYQWQNCSITIASVLEIQKSCTKPSSSHNILIENTQLLRIKTNMNNGSHILPTWTWGIAHNDTMESKVKLILPYLLCTIFVQFPKTLKHFSPQVAVRGIR